MPKKYMERAYMTSKGLRGFDTHLRVENNLLTVLRCFTKHSKHGMYMKASNIVTNDDTL